MKKIALLLLAAIAFCPGHARAFLHHGVGGSGGQPPFIVDDPQILGTDFPQAGTSVPFTLDTGAWNNSPLSYSCNWHFVGGSSLGTSCAGLTLDTTTSGVLGSALQVDVTASNLAGSSTVRSHWIGPIEASAPVLPVQMELSAIPALSTGTLPVEPMNFLQNGHAVFPGCAIPPIAPANTATTGNPAHVWYFDPVNGLTQAQQTANGVPTASQGHIGHPFKDQQAIFTGFPGYNQATVTSVVVSSPNFSVNGSGFLSVDGTHLGTAYVSGLAAAIQGLSSNTLLRLTVPAGTTPTTGNTFVYLPLWSNTIVPGDTIYIEPGDVSHPLGGIVASSNYSTSDYTNTGTLEFTWIMPDPAAATLPLLSGIVVSGSSTTGSSGFIFKNFSIEGYRQAAPGAPSLVPGLVALNGTEAGPTHDNHFEHLRISQWLGHSNDPWYPSPYPSTGGSSDGTVLTASPTFDGNTEQPTFITATGAANATVVAMSSIPPIGQYVWSPGQIYDNNTTHLPATGIPSGTIIAAVNGLTPANYSFSGGTVNAFQASQLTANTLGGSNTSELNLPQSGSADTTGFYWLVAASGTVAQTVYAWSTNLSFIFYLASHVPLAGDTITINSIAWTWVNGTAGANQITLGGNLSADMTAAAAAFNSDSTMSGIATYAAVGGNQLNITWVTPGSNFPIAASTTSSFSAAWAVVGSIPPSAPTIANLVLVATINNHVLHWNGSNWDDLGTPTMTIAPCDPINDHATGCPANPFPGLSGAGSNVPGCDPFVTYPGGTSSGGLSNGACTGGTPIPWNGLTRALTGELVDFTASITITPSGYWNYADWDGGGGVGILFSGGAGVTQINPSQPNNFVGSYCNSAKDNIVRDGAAGISATRSYDSILYNNKIKYMSVDAHDTYSDNRVWVIHELYTDVAFLWAHQDFNQWGVVGTNEGATYFGDASIENIGVQYTDTTNWFPREMQGINTTDETYWGMYVCCNLMIASTNGIGVTGQYDVAVQNTEFPKAVAIGNQTKSGVSTAVYSFMGNNIANGINRQSAAVPASWTPNFCAVGAGDFSTVVGNMSIPGAGITGATSSLLCTSDAVQISTGGQGTYVGVTQWAAIDWQSGAGVSSLFNAYHPISAPVEPNPGWTTLNLNPPFNLCLVVPNLYPPGTCSPTANGSIDMRPNSSFSGFTSPIVKTLTPGNSTGKAFNLPSGQAVGAYAITTTDGFTGGQDYPIGLWQYCPTGSGAGGCPTYATNPYTSANGWYFISATLFNPGIINAGTNLGAEQPITDLLGNAWNNPPSIGALQ